MIALWWHLLPDKPQTMCRSGRCEEAGTICCSSARCAAAAQVETTGHRTLGTLGTGTKVSIGAATTPPPAATAPPRPLEILNLDIDHWYFLIVAMLLLFCTIIDIHSIEAYTARAFNKLHPPQCKFSYSWWVWNSWGQIVGRIGS